MKKEEALELVGDLVERIVEISKEEDMDVIDYEDLKKELRVILLKGLGEKIEEPISSSAEESVLKEVTMFEKIEEPIVPLKRPDEPIISVEVGREDTESDLPIMGIKLEEYPPMSFKRIEKEGTANASFSEI